MFGWFKPESPLTPHQRCWIDDRFAWLKQQFGEAPVRKDVVTPTREFFPDHYDGTPEAAAILLDRLCGYMDVDRTRLELHFSTSPCPDDLAASSKRSRRGECALYPFGTEGGRTRIWLEQTGLGEPYQVVSILAHELGHVRLLADERCDLNATDYELLTDLLTVYFGLGIFRANTALWEVNKTAGEFPGGNVIRLGQMTIPEYSYALVLYARARDEVSPRWLEYLRLDACTYFEIESNALTTGTVGSEGTLTDPGDSVPGQPVARELPETADHLDDEVGDSERYAPEVVGDEDHAQIVEDWPEFDPAADDFTRGCQHAAAGEHDLALTFFSRALELNPDDSEALLEKARSLFFLKRFSEAIDSSTRCLKRDPDCLAALRCRATRTYGSINIPKP